MAGRPESQGPGSQQDAAGQSRKVCLQSLQELRSEEGPDHFASEINPSNG